jgi:EmrB/QacA subfamily drug resistance transporter
MNTKQTKTTSRTLVFVSILLGMFMVAIEGTIIATAMPDIVRRVGGFTLYTWVFSAFLLTQAATTVLFGKLADLYGRRPVLVGGIIIFLIGSILCGFAWSMPFLIAFRLLQGLGAGSILPVATTVIGDLYTVEERAKVQGYLASVWGISAVVGPLVGGIIVEKLSWPWVFWINVPIGIATIIGLTSFLHEGIERKRHSLDILGAILFATAISSLMIVLTQLGQPSGASSSTILFGALFIVCVPIFFWHERRAKEPMIALEIWSHRVIASANAAVLVAGMTLMGITSFLAIYVQGVMGRSATVAGFTLTMMAVGWPIASIVARPMYKVIGMRGTLRVGSVLMVAGSAIFLFLQPDSSPTLAGAGSMVVGFGMGLLNVTVILMVQGSVGWRQRGSATASNVFSRTLGSTLGAAVLGSVLNLSLKSHPGVSAEGIRQLLESRTAVDPALLAALHQGLHLTFWCVVVLGIVTVAVALFIPSRELADLGGAADAATGRGE